MSKLLHCRLFIVLLSTLTFIPIADGTTDTTSKPPSSGDVTSKTNENNEIINGSDESAEETTRNDENLEDSSRSVEYAEGESPSDENVGETTATSEKFEKPPSTDESTWTTQEIIQHYGYRFEGHSVTTRDGYVLQLHRIPQKENDPINKNYPVLIPHCVGGSSADWVLAGPEGSLAMQLSTAGYDVWLANNRGNAYSRTHIWKATESNEYWDFNLHELGTLDLPAIIDFIKTSTKIDEMHYIGYSMSTCIFYIMASQSENIKYHETIRSQISMAPVSSLGHAKSSVRMLVPIAKSLDYLYQRFSYGEFNAENSITRKMLLKVCNNKITRNIICLKMILFAICGQNKETFNKKILSRIVGHYPGSTSSKLVLHLSQFIRRGKFAKLSFGKTKNMQIYDQREPPLYNLESINVPITLIHAENDKLVRPKDVKKLAEKLPMLMDVIKVPDKYFNHVDFLWNEDVKVKINDVIIGILNKTDQRDWKYIKKEET